MTEEVIKISGAQSFTEQRTRFKAISAFLPYAIWLERNRRPEMLDVFLHAARASGALEFAWRHVDDPSRTLLLRNATPRAIMLISPYIPWHWLHSGEVLVQLWVAAASAVQRTDEVAQSVVDTLLVIASREERLRHIMTVDVWSWLTKQPSLPPVCLGRFHGSRLHIVKAVRGLGDIEILKSYFLLVWSEWDSLQDEGFDEICGSLHEDFGGVGMGHHRFDLVQRLDQILGRLDPGFENLERRRDFPEPNPQKKRDQYEKLKDILLEMNIGATSRGSYLTIVFLCILTQGDIQRLANCLCVRFPCHIHRFTPVPGLRCPHPFPRRAHGIGSLPPFSSTGDFH